MKRDAYGSPFVPLQHNAPYNLILAPQASASSSSVWSDASSQHSDDSHSSATSSDSDSCDSYCFSQSAPSSQSSVSSIGSSCEPLNKLLDSNPKLYLPPQQQQVPADLPLELRQNPRRTSNSVTSRAGRPPTLVRQADRKVNFVDNLIDSSAHIVEAIWPTSSVVARNEQGGNAVLPLRTFIQETLRRSRTSYSTLQVALYYLILIKPRVPDRDFTMEQPDDCHASQAIQCGRRMFLAALILASKYLQDRNYSARAWSKISGLHTNEINQNEMAFLLAVNWKLHITDDVYNRWTECVMKFTPPQPPASGAAAQRLYERQCEEFRAVILTLTPELDNFDALNAYAEAMPRARPIFTPSERTCAFGYDSELAPKPHVTPAVMEPTPASVYTPGRFAPALGLLPTPRLTPQTSGFSTPAVSAASYLLSKGSMGFAMAQVSCTAAAQSLDRWPASATSSPQNHFTRRSSLANSISTASSPESMVSDSSRLSRSSSISSASSVSAPSAKLDVLARCRYAKLCSERSSLRLAIASVPEDYEVDCLTASPESYTGPVGKDFHDMSLETPLARRQREMDDAARALQELQRHGQVRAGSKRSRTASIDNSSLQENVRDMLAGRFMSGGSAWSDSMIRGRPQQMPVHATLQGSNKRLCCSTEAAEPFMMSSLHPAMGGVGGPGMWGGILP
ncbi:hypothetical protein B0H67DRAFT_476734 [Lasiosphaeris hirsuta]|uniref:G1/S-specific cyclin pas1 n=1 Tax=Lasiosphaeris hirsuta TaxID=260670 RepID=A0AA40E7H2_9PEZI|nr:hypothetical protein B0H67DRAFT_476734 [Lasiosphaeris hirsuta]